MLDKQQCFDFCSLFWWCVHLRNTNALSLIRRVTSTPDPNTWKVSRQTSHFYRDTFAKVCPPLGRKKYIHHQFVSQCTSHLYRDAFWKVFRSGVVGAPQTKAASTGWPRFGSVRLRFGDGTVRAVLVFGSGGSSNRGVGRFLCFSTISQRGRFRFRFRFLENPPRHFLRGSSSQGWVAQLLAGTDAGTGVRGHVGVWGDNLLFSPHSTGGFRGRAETHTHTHTHTHTGTHTHTQEQERTRECCTYPLATYPLKSPRKTVPAVPVPRSVPAKTVPTVPVSGSGSVRAKPCIYSRTAAEWKWRPGCSPSWIVFQSSGTKKEHKHNQTPPPNPGTPDRANSLCWGLFSLQNTGKRPIHKEFWRGGSWGPQIFFMLNFFGCFLCTWNLRAQHLKQHLQKRHVTLSEF